MTLWDAGCKGFHTPVQRTTSVLPNTLSVIVPIAPEYSYRLRFMSATEHFLLHTNPNHKIDVYTLYPNVSWFYCWLLSLFIFPSNVETPVHVHASAPVLYILYEISSSGSHIHIFAWDTLLAIFFFFAALVLKLCSGTIHYLRSVVGSVNKTSEHNHFAYYLSCPLSTNTIQRSLHSDTCCSICIPSHA